MATKRSLSPSHSPPLHKAPRAEDSKPPRELLCNLPPTCNKGRGTVIFGTRELEAHYAKYHAHACEVAECECVFPDARLFELHFTECHDPLSEVRRERGEKIFACHLASCGRYFRTPKTRRIHLIQEHGYPKEYFFAVTNKGIGGLIRKWGEGASLIRGTWKARGPVHATGVDSDLDIDEKTQDSIEEEEVLPTLRNGALAPPQDVSATNSFVSAAVSAYGDASGRRSVGAKNGVAPTVQTKPSVDADELADTMSALSLVPSSVRFGRGAKSSGHSGRQSRTPQHTQAHPKTVVHSKSSSQTTEQQSTGQLVAPQPQAELMDQDVTPSTRGGRGHPRGPRGRGGVPRGGLGLPRGVQRGLMYRGGRGRGG